MSHHAEDSAEPASPNVSRYILWAGFCEGGHTSSDEISQYPEEGGAAAFLQSRSHLPLILGTFHHIPIIYIAQPDADSTAAMPYPQETFFSKLRSRILHILSCCGGEKSSARGIEIGHPTNFQRVPVTFEGLTAEQHAFINSKVRTDTDRILAGLPPSPVASPSPFPASTEPSTPRSLRPPTRSHTSHPFLTSHPPELPPSHSLPLLGWADALSPASYACRPAPGEAEMLPLVPQSPRQSPEAGSAMQKMRLHTRRLSLKLGFKDGVSGWGVETPAARSSDSESGADDAGAGAASGAAGEGGRPRGRARERDSLEEAEGEAGWRWTGRDSVTLAGSEKGELAGKA